MRKPPKRTILFYRGNSEKHAFVKMVSHARPFCSRTYRADEFDEFAMDLVQMCESHFVSVRGETKADEDWIFDNMQKGFLADPTNDGE